MNTTSTETPGIPCDCIEKCGKYWVQRCSCHNSGDLAAAEAWCREQNDKAKMATQTDTPETLEALSAILEEKGELCEDTAPAILVRLCKRLERRARAAESRLAKWEAELSKVMPSDFKDWWQNSRDEWPEIARRVIQDLRKNAELVESAADAALRLRPIAEAGPVPDGMIRLYAHRIPLGPPGAEFWSAFSETDEEDTHCVDVFPPAEAQEGQARP